jgi:8-oxo-dGTP diphosphatase
MMIRVTCAIIEQYGRVLVTQRSSSMSQPMLWEFPGGKLEKGESEEEGLKREIKEELNLHITPMLRLTPVTQDYGDKTIELIPYISEYNMGAIHLAEHHCYQWAHPDDLPGYIWCPADLPIVKEYLAFLKTKTDSQV